MADGLPAYWDRFSENFFRESFSSAAEATTSFSAWADKLHRRDLSDPELWSRRVVEWALWIFGAKLARASLRIDQTGIDDLSGCDSLKALLFFKDAMVDTDTALVLSLFGQAARPLLSSDALTKLLDEHEVDDESAILMHNSVFSDGIPGKIPATAAGWSAAASDILLGPFPAFQTTEVFMEKVTRLYGIAETQAPFFAKGAPDSSKMAVSPVDTPNSGQSQPHFRVSGRAHMAHLWKTLAEAPDNPRHVRSLVYSAHFLAHWSFMLRRRTLRGDEHKKIEAFIDAARAYLANVTDVSPETDAFGALRAVYDATVAGHICDMFTSVDILASVPADSTEWCLLTGFGLAPVPLDACAPLFGPVVHHKMSLFFEESARSAGVSAAQPVCTAGLLDYARSAVSSSTYSELTAEDGARLSALTDDLSGKLRPADVILYRNLSSLLAEPGSASGGLSLSAGIRLGAKIWFEALAYSAELDMYFAEPTFRDIESSPLDSKIYRWAELSSAGGLSPRRGTMWLGTIAGFAAVYVGYSVSYWTGLLLMALCYAIRGLIFMYKRSYAPRDGDTRWLDFIDKSASSAIATIKWATLSYGVGSMGRTSVEFGIAVFNSTTPTSFEIGEVLTPAEWYGMWFPDWTTFYGVYTNMPMTLVYGFCASAISSGVRNAGGLAGRFLGNQDAFRYYSSMAGHAAGWAYFGWSAVTDGGSSVITATFLGIAADMTYALTSFFAEVGVGDWQTIVSFMFNMLVAFSFSPFAKLQTAIKMAPKAVWMLRVACVAISGYIGRSYATASSKAKIEWKKLAVKLPVLLRQQFRDVRLLQGISIMAPPLLLLLSNELMEMDGEITENDLAAMVAGVVAVSSSPYGLAASAGAGAMIGATFRAYRAVYGMHGQTNTFPFVIRLQSIGITIALTGLIHTWFKLYEHGAKRSLSVVEILSKFDGEKLPGQDLFAHMVETFVGKPVPQVRGVGSFADYVSKLLSLGAGPFPTYYAIFSLIQPVVFSIVKNHRFLCRESFDSKGRYFNLLLDNMAAKIETWPSDAPQFISAVNRFVSVMQMKGQNTPQAHFEDLVKEIWEAFFVVRYQNDGNPYERSRLKATISSKYKDELGWVSDALFQLTITPLCTRDIDGNFFGKEGKKASPLDIKTVPFYVQLNLGSEKLGDGTTIFAMFKFVLEVFNKEWNPELDRLGDKEARKRLIDRVQTNLFAQSEAGKFSINVDNAYQIAFPNELDLRNRIERMRLFFSGNRQNATMTWISHKNYSANPDEYKYAADGSKTTEESKGGPAVGRPVATEIRKEIASRFETSPILIVATAPGYEKGAKWQQLNFPELANENFKPTIMSVMYFVTMVLFQQLFRDYIASAFADDSKFVLMQNELKTEEVMGMRAERTYGDVWVQLINDTAGSLVNAVNATRVDTDGRVETGGDSDLGGAPSLDATNNFNGSLFAITTMYNLPSSKSL